MRHWRMNMYTVAYARLRWRDLSPLAFYPGMKKQRFVLENQYRFGGARGGDIDG